jgi:hypothetical protein
VGGRVAGGQGGWARQEGRGKRRGGRKRGGVARCCCSGRDGLQGAGLGRVRGGSGADPGGPMGVQGLPWALAHLDGLRTSSAAVATASKPM